MKKPKTSTGTINLGKRVIRDWRTWLKDHPEKLKEVLRKDSDEEDV